MLFLLTGDIQIGKTRWLEQLVGDMRARGVKCAGVVAPGVWRERTAAELAAGEGNHGGAAAGEGNHGGAAAGEGRFEKLSAGKEAPQKLPANKGRFEKLGIDNVLLPSGERISFARRRDLAQKEGSYDEKSQSGRARLAWNISDEAIARVNAHFDALAGAMVDGASEVSLLAAPSQVGSSSDALTSARAPYFLVVDELGQLELMRDGGLTSAVALLERGANPQVPHALVVVREWLLDCARERFGQAWGEVVPIGPTDDARVMIFESFSL